MIYQTGKKRKILNRFSLKDEYVKMSLNVGCQVTAAEFQKILADLKKKIVSGQKEEIKKAAEKNLAEGKTFLSENEKKRGVKILESGLQYRILKKGSGALSKATDMVTLHYKGNLIDGTEFDSSYKRGEPATFRADSCIRGWIEALQIMNEGAKWKLFVPPDLAYGERGAGLISPNSTLVFNLELISVQASK